MKVYYLIKTENMIQDNSIAEVNAEDEIKPFKIINFT